MERVGRGCAFGTRSALRLCIPCCDPGGSPAVERSAIGGPIRSKSGCHAGKKACFQNCADKTTRIWVLGVDTRSVLVQISEKSRQLSLLHPAIKLRRLTWRQ